MKNGCVIIHDITWHIAGGLAKLDIEFCECCNFTEARVMVQPHQQPTDPDGYNITEMPHIWPGDELLVENPDPWFIDRWKDSGGTGVLGATEWYLGPPLGVVDPFHPPTLPKDCFVCVVARCCDGPTWLRSVVWFIDFQKAPPAFPPEIMPYGGYSAGTPPSSGSTAFYFIEPDDGAITSPFNLLSELGI